MKRYTAPELPKQFQQYTPVSVRLVAASEAVLNRTIERFRRLHGSRLAVTQARRHGDAWVAFATFFEDSDAGKG